MSFKLRHSFPAILLFLGLSSCTPGKASAPKHNFGETSDGILGDRKLERCRSSDEARPSVRYLNALLDHFAKSHPVTFKDFPPQSFCFDLIDDTGINGAATPRHGHIRLTRGVFLAAKSDADVAAVLAHEIAHVTLRHDILSETRLVPGVEALLPLSERESVAAIVKEIEAASDVMAARLNDALAGVTPSAFKTPAVTAVMKEGERSSAKTYGSFLESLETAVITEKQCSDACGSFRVGMKLAKDAYAKVVKKTQAVERILEPFGLVEEFYNGREREADEVGFEIYLRGGFPPDRYLATLAESKGCAPLPSAASVDRGFDSHPHACWRRRNIIEGEMHSHMKEIDALPHVKVPMFNPSLSEVKADLQGT